MLSSIFVLYLSNIWSSGGLLLSKNSLLFIKGVVNSAYGCKPGSETNIFD